MSAKLVNTKIWIVSLEPSKLHSRHDRKLIV